MPLFFPSIVFWQLYSILVIDFLKILIKKFTTILELRISVFVIMFSGWKIPYGWKLGLGVGFIGFGFFFLGSFYLYTKADFYIWESVRAQILRIGQAGVLLFKEKEIKMLTVLDQRIESVSVDRKNLVQTLQSGFSATNLTNEQILNIKKSYEYQTIKQILYQIWLSGKNTPLSLENIYGSNIMTHEENFTKYVYLLSSIPESPDYSVVKFIIDLEDEAKDENQDGVIGVEEEEASPGLLYKGKKELLEKAFQGEISIDNEYEKDQWATVISGCFPLLEKDSNSTIAILCIDLDVESQVNFIKQLKNIYLLIVLFGSIFIFSSSYFITRILSRPLNELIVASNEASSGNYNVRIREDYNDEFALVSSTFNRMMSEIQKNHRDLGISMENLIKLSKVKDQFLSNLSHEINTPISIIYSYAEFLSTADLAEDDKREYYEIIYSSAEKLKGYIEDLIMITKSESSLNIKKSKLSLQEIVSEIVSKLKHDIDLKNIEIFYLIESGFQIFADRDLFSKALSNIIKNSVQFNKPKGKIIVSAQINHETDSFEIIVQDTGIGIEPQNITFVWNKFYRVDNTDTYTESGVGLGLTISKMIIENHKGSIQMQSEINIGTVVKINLPFL